MKRIKLWLINKFLPIWAKEELLKENEKLRARNQELEIHIKQLNAYIDGLESGMKAQRRIVINTGEVKK